MDGPDGPRATHARSVSFHADSHRPMRWVVAATGPIESRTNPGFRMSRPKPATSPPGVTVLVPGDGIEIRKPDRLPPEVGCQTLAKGADGSGTIPWRSLRMYVIIETSAMAVSGIPLVAPTLPVIKESVGISNVEVGLMMTAYTFPGIVLAPFVGMYTDRIGRRPPLSEGGRSCSASGRGSRSRPPTRPSANWFPRSFGRER